MRTEELRPTGVQERIWAKKAMLPKIVLYAPFLCRIQSESYKATEIATSSRCNGRYMACTIDLDAHFVLSFSPMSRAAQMTRMGIDQPCAPPPVT